MGKQLGEEETIVEALRDSIKLGKELAIAAFLSGIPVGLVIGFAVALKLLG